MEYSRNKLAGEIVGYRVIKGIAFDEPCGLGYHCPKCEYDLTRDGEYNERLHWSEYNGFIWCSVCNIDYPSVMCMPDIEKAIDIYLSCVNDAVFRNKINDKTQANV